MFSDGNFRCVAIAPPSRMTRGPARSSHPGTIPARLVRRVEKLNRLEPLRLNAFSFVDLFSGCGGLGLGFLLAGFRPLAAVDSNRVSCNSHRLNFERYGCMSIPTDVRRFMPRQLGSLLKQAHGTAKVDLILGGPPCQGWSRAGRGKLKSLGRPTHRWENDPRNILFKRFVRYVAHFRPRYFVMENVPGMLSHRGTDVTPHVTKAFGRIGYRTTMYALDAVDFGVPQRRTRLFFIGSPRGSRLPVENLVRPAADLARYHRGAYVARPWHLSVRHALMDLPRLATNHRFEISAYPSRRGRPPRYVRLMRAGLNGLLHDHVTRLHREMDREAFRALRPGMKYEKLDDELKRYRDDIFKDKYRKLSWDQPAGTVTAHLSHDCYTHIHPSQLRTISPREAARLQSFPDGFRFCGNIGDRFRQIGNAVPPLLAYGIATALLARLRKHRS